jgi:hypothetical protein
MRTYSRQSKLFQAKTNKTSDLKYVITKENWEKTIGRTLPNCVRRIPKRWSYLILVLKIATTFGKYTTNKGSWAHTANTRSSW